MHFLISLITMITLITLRNLRCARYNSGASNIIAAAKFKLNVLLILSQEYMPTVFDYLLGIR